MIETVTKAVSFSNSVIIGICTLMEDYKLAHFLNKALNLNFVKCEDVFNDNGNCFSYYYCNCGENDLVYSLVSLKRGAVQWSQDFKQYDYFLIVRQCYSDDTIKKIINKIKEINGVLLTVRIETNEAEVKVKEKKKSGSDVREILFIEQKTNKYQYFLDILDEHEEIIAAQWRCFNKSRISL